MKAVQSTLWLALVLASPALRADEDKPEIQTQDLGQGIYVLFGEGGNVALSAGSDGNFLVDDKWAPQSGAIKAAVQLVGEGAIRFVINTHWHGDHTGGNENFSNAGAVIVAHDNVRKRMSSDQFIEALQWEVPASAPAALPVVTFGDGLKLHLNGNTVQVIHVAHAHTDGDALVLFTEANILHMGDLYFNGMYPFIDL
ncbi:MAG: MBL fold metallo-hydrolase, partial [Xanthomonadales bacterium]|nr:MBL fold metallo-hydrolase [Xanthomonadales bacterium]